MYERTLKKQKNSFFFIDTCEIYNNKYIYISSKGSVCEWKTEPWQSN